MPSEDDLANNIPQALGILEDNFKSTLFARMSVPEIVYSREIVQCILTALMPDVIVHPMQGAKLRVFTFRCLAQLLHTLVFNRACAPHCLREPDLALLEQAYQQACKNLY
jgi:hypothetical protein